MSSSDSEGSSASSSSSSSSRAASPIISSKKSAKAQKKDKEKAKASGEIRNEGTNPLWNYTPLDGFSAVKEIPIPEGFDWESLEADGESELWLIRVPQSIKPKYLESLGLEGFSRDNSKTAKVGSLSRKHTTYDVLSIGRSGVAPPGGEELQGFECLVPRKSRKGKLSIAPKPIARHILINPQPVQPSPEEPGPSPHQSQPRHSYSKDVLKGRFLPVGSCGPIASGDNAMDVDGPEGSVEKDSKKSKKRSGDGPPSPKKSKKSKT